MNNLQKTIVGILFIGGAVILTLSIANKRAEYRVEKAVHEMYQIIGDTK